MTRLLVGCYTHPDGRGEGISSVTASASASVVGRARSPSFLALHPALPVVYAVEELAEGGLVTLRWEDGALAPLDARPALGAHPCHVAVSPAADWVATANFGDGTVSVFPLDRDGRPAAAAEVLRHPGAEPHCHQIVFHAGAMLVTDLGTDRVYRYVTEGGRWVAQSPAVVRAGSGPRHLVVDGPLRCVVGECDVSVTTYRERADGSWEEVGHVATTRSRDACLPSHLVLHDGLLYVANRGPDTIATFSLDDGRPVLVSEIETGGAWPRHFALVDDTLVVANERSHELTVLDLASGAVRRRVTSGSPTCVVPL